MIDRPVTIFVSAAEASGDDAVKKLVRSGERRQSEAWRTSCRNRGGQIAMRWRAARPLRGLQLGSPSV